MSEPDYACAECDAPMTWPTLAEILADGQCCPVCGQDHSISEEDITHFEQRISTLETLVKSLLPEPNGDLF